MPQTQKKWTDLEAACDRTSASRVHLDQVLLEVNCTFPSFSPLLPTQDCPSWSRHIPMPKLHLHVTGLVVHWLGSIERSTAFVNFAMY